MNSTNLKHWLSRGDLDKLENVVLEGKGARLLGEHSSDLRTRVFLKGLPNYLTKITQIHDAVVRGSLPEVRRLIESEPKKKLAIAKDSAGTPLIHKAVYYDHQNVLEWIVDNYPSTVEQKDREGRTALHYCAACQDPEAVWDILIEAGCDASVCDKRGNPAAYYLQHGSEIELPDPDRMTSRRYRKRDTSNWSTSLDFKPSNIRIWIHNRDIGKLQHVLWEGHGSKLRCETSNNIRVRRFLDAVPFIMGTIKDIHAATIKNDLDGFRRKIEEPVSPIILCSKDSNGLNVLHKAAGLGYVDLAKEILDRYPVIVNAPDNEGRTPLHYAAVCRDGGVMYDLLVEYGADESRIDNKQKTAAFYKNRPADVDLSCLVMVPDAPRVSSNSYPRHWDWRIIETDQPLPRMKRTGGDGAAGTNNNADDDSAFGSAESAKLNEDATTPETENTEDDVNGNEVSEDQETEENKDDDDDDDDDDKEKPEVEESSAPDENENPDGENEEAATTAEPEESTTPDDNNNEEESLPAEDKQNDEVEASKTDEQEETTTEADKEITNTDETDEAVPDDDGDNGEKGEGKKEEEETEEDEKAEPSTADSGVVDPSPNDEEQIIVGEHNESGVNENEDAVNTTNRINLSNGLAVEEEEETSKIVETGNMEQLAALVLTGEGHRLVGRTSSSPELQAFIDNVPAYMAKIRCVHKAAREGNLRDLQISLDRRKFAIAKDPSSPHGATPLHVAVIFGHTPIVRYLAGRFPETAHALDLDGRTPLHYAAVLKDNGHYYNLLLHLGANPLVQDNFGQKADFYKKNQKDLSHKQLLRDFGASESLADEMLVDKVPDGDTTSARRDVSEPETLATLERCFRLLTSGVGGGAGAGGTGASVRRSSVPIAGSSSSSSNGTTRGSGGNSGNTAGTLLGRCLRRQVFEAIKHRVTCMDHNLFDVIWPALKKYSNAYASNTSLEEGNINVRERRLSVSAYDDDFTGNVVVPDFESYVVFSELLDPLIRDLHCVTVTGELPNQPSPRFFHEDDVPEPTSNLNDNSVQEAISILEARDLDPSGKYIMAGIVECTRNFADHQLPLTMRIHELEDTERIITSALMGSELTNILAEGSSEDEAGTYYTLSEILDPFNEVRARLAASGLLLPITESENSDEKRLHGKHWPYGRGVYVTSAADLAIWVNVQDHIRVICCSSEIKPALLGKAYVRLATVVNILDKIFEFRRDPKLGFLTSRPSAIGNTVRLDLIIKFSGLSKKPEDLKHLCVVRGLRIHPTLRKDTVRVGNQQSLSIGELQTYQDFDRAVLNVLTLEKEMQLNSSLKIATVIANIFKRRRLSGSRTVRS